MFYKVLGILVWNGAKVVLRSEHASEGRADTQYMEVVP